MCVPLKVEENYNDGGIAEILPAENLELPRNCRNRTELQDQHRDYMGHTWETRRIRA
jgi:hypothetical protein